MCSYAPRMAARLKGQVVKCLNPTRPFLIIARSSRSSSRTDSPRPAARQPSRLQRASLGADALGCRRVSPGERRDQAGHSGVDDPAVRVAW